MATRVIKLPNSNIKKLKVTAKDRIRFSNNIIDLNVVETLAALDIPKHYITEFTCGSNISSLASYCFYECQNLKKVNVVGSKLISIGDYAFYGCNLLTDINLLGDSPIPVLMIGSYAFARSGIKTATLKLNEIYISAPICIGDHAFANCQNLTSIKFTDKNTTSQYMFSGCINLQNVIFNGTSTSLAYAAFEGCTKLQSITFPPSLTVVPENLFNGCTSLTNVSFAGSTLLGIRSLGNYAFYNTPIVSITFPASMNSLDAFNELSLAGMNSLTEIHFIGMSLNLIAAIETQTILQEIPAPIVYQYSFNTIYICKDGDDNMPSKVMEYLQDYGVSSRLSMFTLLNTRSELLNIIKYCVDNSIPLCYMITQLPHDECGNCNKFTYNILNTPDMENFLLNNKKCIMIFGDYLTAHTPVGSLTNGLINAVSGTNLAYYVEVMLFWKRKDGTYERKYEYSVTYKPYFFNTLLGGFANSFNYDGTTITELTVTTTTLNAAITTTDCFGLGHDVTIYTNDGKSIEFQAGVTATGDSGSLIYNSSVVQVDRITVDDFKYALWYRLARELRSYADENELLVLAIATLSAAPNSKKFNLQIFNLQSFLQKIPLGILWCKVDNDGTNDSSSAYLANVWMRESPTRNMPLLMLYLHDKDGLVNIDTGAKLPSDYFSFAYYSEDTNDKGTFSCKCLHNLNEILNWILSEYQSYVNMGYTPKAGFYKPLIKSFLDQYPKYKMYANLLHDNYGRYFPVKILEGPTLEVQNVIVNDSTGQLTEYTLDMLNPYSNLPPMGTYLYFSLPFTEDNKYTYENIYEVSGLIFKIGSSDTLSLLASLSFSYNTKELNSYLAEFGIAAGTYSYTTSFYDIYKRDDSGNPTTTVGDDAASSMPFLYNCTEEVYNFTGSSSYLGKPVTQIKLWLSSAVNIVTYSDGAVVEPASPQYVVSSLIYGYADTATLLLWIRKFNNDPSNFDFTNYLNQVDNNSSKSWWETNDNVYYSSNYINDVVSLFVRSKRARFGSPILPGQWNGYLEQCSAYAIAYELPMIAIWSTYSCLPCEQLENPLMYANNVNNFLSKSNYILCFTTELDLHGSFAKSGLNSYYSFCQKPNYPDIYPFVRFFWYKKNGSAKIVDFSVDGTKLVNGVGRDSNGGYETAGQLIINYIKNYSGIYQPGFFM